MTVAAFRSYLARLSPMSFLLGSFLTLVSVFLGASFRVARVTSDAMAPSYVEGDLVLITALPYLFGPPKRGDVVLLYYPLSPAKLLIDRLIGDEGDTIRIVDGRVIVNEHQLEDDAYVRIDYRSRDEWGPMVIAEGYYFVIGDHRNDSSDSRHWGLVPRRYVWGKAVGRMWSWSWIPRVNRSVALNRSVPR